MIKLHQAKFGSDYNLPPVDVPAEIGYFYVYPFPYNAKQLQELTKLQPSILTYREDDVTLRELLEKLQKNMISLKNVLNLRFTLSGGDILSNKLTIAALCKKFRRTNVNELVLFVQAVDGNEGGEYQDEDSEEYEDECAMTTYYDGGSLEEHQEYIMNINFAIVGTTECVVTVRTKTNSSVKALVEQFLAQLMKFFDVPNLSQSNIAKLQIEEKQALKKLEISEKLISYVSLVNWSNVRVTFKDKMVFKKKVEHPENKIIIYKENSDDYIVEVFQEIWFMPFKNIYEKKLNPKYIKGQRQQVCLNVMDILIREDQNLFKIESYYKGKEGKQYIRIVGRVVSEKMYFYKNMKLLDNQPEQQFQIQKSIFSRDPDEQPGKQRAYFTDSIRQDMKKRAQQSKLQPFKDTKNIEPIYIYTSEFILYKNESGSNKPDPVYIALNKYLRQKNILKKTLKHFKSNWLLRFAHSLINKLKIVETHSKMTVYRGINFDPLVKQGDIMTFKPFTSTSMKQIQTYQFMLKNVDKGQPFLLELQINKGNQIKLLSKFKEEQEILLQPFSQFQVKSIQENSFQLAGKNVTRIKLVQLDEKESSAVYPQIKANFIIWVDDKKDQGRNIYEAISRFEDPTILIQLTSTKELVEWLSQQKVKSIFNDPTSNIIFITNMTREGNFYAGIEGVIELQKCPCHMEIPIVFYIGNKQRAQQNLVIHKEQLKNRQHFLVTNSFREVQQKLIDTLKIKFKTAEEIYKEMQSEIFEKQKKNQSSNLYKTEPIIINKPPVESKPNLPNPKQKKDDCQLI